MNNNNNIDKKLIEVAFLLLRCLNLFQTWFYHIYIYILVFNPTKYKHIILIYFLFSLTIMKFYLKNMNDFN